VVRDFSYAFLEDVLGLPSPQEVEFRIVPATLKELKV